MTDVKAKHSKKILTLRHLLIGAKYYHALRAMEYAKTHHVGLRKDQITPEFEHQVSMALQALTLPDVTFPEELIVTIMLHDVREDYHIAESEILAIFTDDRFARRVAKSVDCLTKKFRGVMRDEDVLFALMAEDPIASLAKGLDRSYNLQTMVGVFTVAKQKSYIDFAVTRILPMLKKARRNFPEQVRAYENIKWVLTSQIELISANLHMLEATK